MEGDIDKKILTIIHTRNNGKPVGFPTIDRALLKSDEEFILNGLLGMKLEELITKGLIQSPNGQVGYSITKSGMKLINIPIS